MVDTKYKLKKSYSKRFIRKKRLQHELKIAKELTKELRSVLKKIQDNKKHPEEILDKILRIWNALGIDIEELDRIIKLTETK